MTALFFVFVSHTQTSVSPNYRKLTDNGDAELFIVFLVDSYSFSISGMIDIFIMISEYTVYSICFCCFAVNNCLVNLMLLTDCNVFVIELVLLCGLCKLCSTFQSYFKESC